MEYSIDAKGKIVGRLASEIAMILMGKNKPNYKAHTVAPAKVHVYNTDFLRMTGNKPKTKKYYRHSGYIGNLKEETVEHLMKRDSRQVLKFALIGMLPKNKLRPRQMKNVTFTKGSLPKT